MKEKNTSRKTRLPLFYLAAILFSALLFLAACKNGDAPDDEDKPSEFKINCLMLSKAQVQVWVDSGWTKPDDQGRIKDLVFQFYSTKASAVNKNLQLLCYPGESYTNVKDNGRTILAVDTSCKGKTYAGEVIIGNNVLSLDKLNIFNPDGTLKRFDFIRFTPEELYRPYINFKVEVIIDGKPDVGGGDNGTLPCPTHCGAD